MNDKHKALVKKLLEEPEKVGHRLGFNDLRKHPHREWIQMFLNPTSDWTLQASRGTYKTTCGSIGLALRIILLPNENMIFLRKSDNDVKEIIIQVEKILEHPFIQAVVRELYDTDLAFTEKTAFAITTNLQTSSMGHSQLLGQGLGTSLTGKHSAFIWTDDICNLKDRVSQATREYTKYVYQELQNIKNRDGVIVNTGTPWHKNDVFSIMPEAVKYDCYQVGLFTTEKLNELREVMTPSLFAANYELKHIADGDALFGSPRFFTDTEKLKNGFGHIDSAYGGSDGTAFTILKTLKEKDEDDNTITTHYIYGKRWDKHIDNCLDEIESLAKEFKVGTIYTELNGDKGFVVRELKKRGLASTGYQESQNKYVKISTHLKMNWQSLSFLQATDTDYLTEILDYTEDAEHDDAPDSLASLLRLKVSTKGWLK